MGSRSSAYYQLFTLIFFGFSHLNISAQLSIDTSLSVQQMVREVLLDAQSDMLIRNIKFSGSKHAIGAFRDEQDGGLMKSGLILSTGDVFDARGPNKSISTSGRTSGRSDEDLQAIATGIVTDAAVLEFDLLALRDSLVFEYVFASEEYPEYVDKGVNDVFGFFIREVGRNALRPYNLAKLDDNRTTVSIDNVNHRRNEEYFLRSDFLHAHSSLFWRNNPDMAMRARTFEFDGFTIPLTAKMKLVEGKWYHFKIAIADVGDRLYDSAVLIKAKSFGSKGPKITDADKIVKEFVKEQLREIDFLTLVGEDKMSFDLTIQFNTNESIIQKSSYAELNQLVKILNDFPALQLNIIGHTDNRGSATDNMALSKRRSKAVSDYLGFRKINTQRIKTYGKGESQPKTTNETEEGRFKNRRVEFELIY